MTEEVAFSGRLLPMVVWLWRSNTTHASAGEHTAGCTRRTQNDNKKTLYLPSLLTCVPRVVAVRPGQHRLEAVGEVEEGPGQDDDVVNTAMQDHHLAGVAQTCRDTVIHSLRYELSAEMQYYICTVPYFKDLYFDMFYKCPCDRLYKYLFKSVLKHLCSFVDAPFTETHVFMIRPSE